MTAAGRSDDPGHERPHPVVVSFGAAQAHGQPIAILAPSGHDDELLGILGRVSTEDAVRGEADAAVYANRGRLTPRRQCADG